MAIVEGEAPRVLDINPRVNQGLLAQMEDRISKSHPSTLPRETSANKKDCIFRLPRRLKNINGKSLEPQVVALGPYHHGKPQLRKMEELKWRGLASFMEGRKKQGKLEECLKELGLLEKEVRECYSETIKLSSDELLQMMVVDGCFILMLFFRAFSNLTELERDERSTYNNPLYRLDMVILPKIYRDLLLLENQIPSCVLKTLYRICFNISSKKYSLFVIAMNFLCSISVIPKSRNMPDSLEGSLHLLDLVRSIFISCRHNKEMWRTHNGSFSPIPCVTKLRRAGIKVNRHMADSFLDVKFKNGVIEMPDIILDDSMCSLLVNCVVFEQSCNISKHFSIYTTLLDCLVNTARDVDYLCDHHIIDNFVGTDAEAAQFINNLGKNLTIYKDRDNNIGDFFCSDVHGDNDDFFLLDVFGDVNEYYRKRLSWGNWQWMTFKREYFGKPWLLISAFVGFVLLVLTFLQTYYTIYAYVHPKK